MSERTVGDTAPPLTGAVSASVVGATDVEAHIRRPDGTTIDRDVSVVSAAAGTWSLPFITGDLTVSGTYRVEIEVTFADGKIQTFANSQAGLPGGFTVRDQYA